MKGVSVNQLRALVSSTLDKVDVLLQSEPARLIGYGAAAVIFIVIKVLNDHGIVRFGTDVSFTEALGATAGAIAVTVTVVESIRKFVYSPQTFIEELSDESAAAHEQAHMEEDLKRQFEEAMARREAQQQAKANEPVVMAVGTLPQGQKSN